MDGVKPTIPTPSGITELCRVVEDFIDEAILLQIIKRAKTLMEIIWGFQILVPSTYVNQRK